MRAEYVIFANLYKTFDFLSFKYYILQVFEYLTTCEEKDVFLEPDLNKDSRRPRCA